MFIYLYLTIVIINNSLTMHFKLKKRSSLACEAKFAETEARSNWGKP